MSLVSVQEPQSTFHKDEGGKTNTLIYRVRLDGDIDLAFGGSKGEIPFTVEAVFEDGTKVPNQREVIDILGCTEKPSGEPCLSLASRTGGVTYRLKQVSKRLDDRLVSVRLSLPPHVPVAPITSTGTIVYSKRKNKEQRELQQQLEKEDMERREEEAVQQLLQAKRARVDDRVSIDAEIAQLKERVAKLERVVHEQQETMAILLPVPPSLQRSVSQATWGIPSSTSMPSAAPAATAAFQSGGNGNFGFPTALKRGTSIEDYALQRLTSSDHSQPPLLGRELSADPAAPDLAAFDDTANH